MPEALLRLQSISFEGAATYRQPSGVLPLANQGCVLLCGPEGSGKSIIPEVATMVLYGRGSPRMRSSGLVESTIVNKDTGYIGELTFESGFGAAARHVVIRQSFKHKREGSRYVITIDGKRDTTVGKPQQKILVKRLAPLSLGEWLGVVYLPQSGIHDLLLGTPTQKRAYLTSVFGLDFYDDLIKEAQLERDNLDREALGAVDLQSRLADVREQIAEVKEQIAALPPRPEVEAGVQKLSDRLQSTSKELGRLEGIRETQAKRAALQADIDKILWASSWKNKATVEEVVARAKADQKKLQIEYGKVEAQMATANAQQAAYDQAKTNLDRETALVASYKKQIEKAMDEARGLPAPKHLISAEKLLQEADKRGLMSLSFKKDTKQFDDWRAAARYLQDTNSMVEKINKLAKHAKDGPCPTCARHLSKTEIEAMRTGIESQAFHAQNWAASLFIVDLRQYLDKSFWPGGGTVEDLLTQTREAIIKADRLRSLSQDLTITEQERKRAEEALKKLTKPKDITKLEQEFDAIGMKLDEAENEVTYGTKTLALFTQLEALATTEVIDDIEAAITALRDKKAKTNTKYQRALVLKQELDQVEATFKALKKQRADLKARIEQHAATVLTLKHYDDTLIPYFTTLRASKVRSCVGILQTVLPVYVSAVATDQYRGAEMKLEVSEDLDIDLLLRPSKFGPWLSPVQASGGQRQRFTLSIIPALYEVSPRKANVLWLDEPFSGMQSDGKMTFLNRLVPLLRERCKELESVFIIAHDNEVLNAANDVFDSVWTADRTERGSTITIGQRLAMVAGT